MAAGSVMKEPSSGTTDMHRKKVATSRDIGIIEASRRTTLITVLTMGRLAAMTITTNTNIGSVKLRSSR